MGTRGQVWNEEIWVRGKHGDKGSCLSRAGKGMRRPVLWWGIRKKGCEVGVGWFGQG